jgi:hypothetical protein
MHYTHADDQTGVVRFPSAATVDCEHGHSPSDATPAPVPARRDVVRARGVVHMRRHLHPAALVTPVACAAHRSGRDATCDAIVCESSPARAREPFIQ